MPADTEMAGKISPQHLQSAQPLLALEPKYFTHTVRGTGETFIDIARWYTGNGNNWKRLVQANPDINPQRIQIGDAIRVPEEIVIKRRPMTRSAPSAT
ncbi:MAG TPA: LysM domain-containing protein, partial [Desulfobacterales bacterium]|nr:LysM domain-containing protein [Desulfobacterales bacterium]